MSSRVTKITINMWGLDSLLLSTRGDNWSHILYREQKVLSNCPTQITGTSHLQPVWVWLWDMLSLEHKCVVQLPVWHLDTPRCERAVRGRVLEMTGTNQDIIWVPRPQWTSRHPPLSQHLTGGQHLWQTGALLTLCLHCTTLPLTSSHASDTTYGHSLTIH